jgi:hypothetical protein
MHHAPPNGNFLAWTRFGSIGAPITTGVGFKISHCIPEEIVLWSAPLIEQDAHTIVRINRKGCPDLNCLTGISMAIDTHGLKDGFDAGCKKFWASSWLGIPWTGASSVVTTFGGFSPWFFSRLWSLFCWLRITA